MIHILTCSINSVIGDLTFASPSRSRWRYRYTSYRSVAYDCNGREVCYLSGTVYTQRTAWSLRSVEVLTDLIQVTSRTALRASLSLTLYLTYSTYHHNIQHVIICQSFCQIKNISLSLPSSAGASAVTPKQHSPSHSVIQPQLFVHSNNFMLLYSFYHCAAWVQSPEGSCCHKYHFHLNYLSHEVGFQNHQRLHYAEQVTGVPHYAYTWVLCNTWCSLVAVHCQWSILY